jgi:hypothetical protein
MNVAGDVPVLVVVSLELFQKLRREPFLVRRSAHRPHSRPSAEGYGCLCADTSRPHLSTSAWHFVHVPPPPPPARSPPAGSSIARASLVARGSVPKEIGNWSLTSLQQRLVKTGGRLAKHARYYGLLLAEGHLTRQRFGRMLRGGRGASAAERVANPERPRTDR